MSSGSPEAIRRIIFDTIEQQLHDDDPPETGTTLKRLMLLGNSRPEAMKLIGCVVSSELFDAMKYGAPFDRERYVTNLKRLPKLPWE